jgi:L-cysteine/cystine lyase
VVEPFLPDDAKVAAVRAALPATGAGIHLDAATAGPLPAEVAAAMDAVSGRELATGRSGPAREEELAERRDEARAAIAALVGGDLERIALTRSTTDGLAAGVLGLDWRPGDVAVTTSLEHPALLGLLAAARERHGIEVRVVAAAEPGGLAAAVAAALDDRTRVVACSHVAWTSGARLPVEEIAAAAHDAGALVVVDGAQAAGAIRVDPGALGADLYAFPARKWLLGPGGVGAAWVGPAALERLRPVAPGPAAVARVAAVEAGRLVAPVQWPDARRFDSPGLDGPAVAGAARACGWLAMFVGLDWLADRGGRLARATAERLAALPGVGVETPRDRMATIVSFRIDGWSAEEAADELGARVFAILRAFPDEGPVRISVGGWASEAELDRFVAAVAELAAHTPATLPPRRRLPILGDA